MLTSDPVRVLGDALGSLRPARAGWSKAASPTSASSTAHAEWRVDAGGAAQPGQAHAVRFAGTGMLMPGRVRSTLVAGTLAYEAGAD